MNRKYELVYIVSPDATDEQVADLHTQVDAIVQRLGGQLEKTENWGRRKLAYEIGRHKEGTYVLEIINGGGDLMKEIDRRLKVSDLVIRHLVVRVDEEQGVVEPSGLLQRFNQPANATIHALDLRGINLHPSQLPLPVWRVGKRGLLGIPWAQRPSRIDEPLGALPRKSRPT